MIEDIVHQIKLATEYQTNKRILREKIITDLHVTYNGGMFLITTDLLSFLATWPEDEIYLEDAYQNPIKVNTSEFLKLTRQHYQKVMNIWHDEHAKLRQIRKV